jgi:hypothetical protein
MNIDLASMSSIAAIAAAGIYDADQPSSIFNFRAINPD